MLDIEKTMFEVYRDGVPLNNLFATVEQAQEWIDKQTDNAKYQVFPFGVW